jgi:hypothetical protein
MEKSDKEKIEKIIRDRASRDEIIEAVGVGIEMSGGPGTVSARFALSVLEYYSNQ